MKFLIRVLMALFGIALTGAIAGGVTAGTAWYFLSPGLPSVEHMQDVPLQVPLRIYSRDARLIAQLGEYRRIPVRYSDLPAVVVQAVLAAEDDRFFEHPGFDYEGLIRAGSHLVLTGNRTQGGSTITQQLARAYFLSPERTFVRKAKELLLALQIEQAFSKEDILALYLNKIFFGQRAYGIAAAAEVYFGKPLEQLSVAEAATIAGIPKAPSLLNPVSDPARAEERRAYVLRRMLELEFIDAEAYQQALATPVKSHLHVPVTELDAPYIAEMVRAEMVARFGTDITSRGYRVTTTIDSRLQASADRALRTALLEYDRRHGYRGATARADGPLPADDAGRQRLLDAYPVHPDLYPALVTELNADNSATLFVHDIGQVTVPWTNLKWRRYIDDETVGPAQQSVAELLSAGDVVYLLRTVNRGWLLAQLPVVQGAMVALDPLDGATVALSGGYDFFASKFNRAVQAKRQPGSSFKPFVYSAALEHGFTPATIVNDAPVVFENTGTDADEWRPQNNSGEFYGPTRLREGLVKSLNLVTIRVLLRTGVSRAIRYISPFGLPDSAMPPNPTMALGSGEATPRDMAAGFAVFANGGYRVEPYLIDRIEDADGMVIHAAPARVVCTGCTPRWFGPQRTTTGKTNRTWMERLLPRCPARTGPEIPAYLDAKEMIAHAQSWQPGPLEAPEFMSTEGRAPRIITAENAYLLYDMMRDVVRRGTGVRARALGRDDIAGKTGTSNDRRDAWFSGFNGQLVATAWVGFDQERSLGSREEGGRTALPMWMYFMADALHGVPETPLARPAGVVTARISAETGQLAAAGEPGSIFELFRESDLEALEMAGSAATGRGLPAAPAGNENEIF
jgi:penicillin-binding protein 1A